MYISLLLWITSSSYSLWGFRLTGGEDHICPSGQEWQVGDVCESAFSMPCTSSSVRAVWTEEGGRRWRSISELVAQGDGVPQCREHECQVWSVVMDQRMVVTGARATMEFGKRSFCGNMGASSITWFMHQVEQVDFLFFSFCLLTDSVVLRVCKMHVSHMLYSLSVFIYIFFPTRLSFWKVPELSATSLVFHLKIL